MIKMSFTTAALMMAVAAAHAQSSPYFPSTKVQPPPTNVVPTISVPAPKQETKLPTTYSIDKNTTVAPTFSKDGLGVSVTRSTK